MSSASSASKCPCRVCHAPDTRSSRNRTSPASAPGCANKEIPACTAGPRYAAGRAQYAPKNPSMQSHGTGNPRDLDPRAGVERLGVRRHRWELPPVDLHEPGQVVLQEPEGVGVWIPRQQHDASSGYPRALGKPECAVGPVVEREDGHDRVKRPVGERQRLGPRLHSGSRIHLPLGEHHARRLDRYHGSVGRLVGARAGADVEHRLRAAERRRQLGGDARIGASLPCIAASVPLAIHIAHY